MVQKIYLSKSKAANPDVVISTKKAIKEHSIDIQILAFEGGSYDPNLKYTADMGITVGPSPSHVDANGTKVVYLGRGGFEESKELEKAGKRVGIVLYEKGQDPLEWRKLKIGIPVAYTETKENYQVNWGYVEIGQEVTFDEFISGTTETKKEDIGEVPTANGIDDFFNIGLWDMEPTEKQLNYIKFIEEETGIDFTGKTKEEASKYISENKDKVPISSTINMWALVKGY